MIFLNISKHQEFNISLEMAVLKEVSQLVDHPFLPFL
jgi:hypothetical protein